MRVPPRLGPLAASLSVVLLLAGCAAPADDPAPAGADDVVGAVAEAIAQEVVVSSMTLTHTGQAAAAGQNAVVLFQREGEFHALQPDAPAALVEMVWTPTSPVTQELTLFVRDASTGAPLAEVAGLSPLRVVLEDPPRGIGAMFAPRGPGLVPHQAVDFHLSEFTGPVPDGYTAAG